VRRVRLNGLSVAGMSISFPTFRYDPTREGAVVAMLTDASRDISARLGCTQFPLDAAGHGA
jgi:IclR family KDG regulon transcriptional repressor